MGAKKSLQIENDEYAALAETLRQEVDYFQVRIFKCLKPLRLLKTFL